MPNFFIDRPIFAWVIAIIIMLAGGLAILKLPVAQYPTIAPPAVTISASYPGADAKTVQDTVTQVIEQNMNGIDNLMYMSSNSDSTGTVQITLTFESGTDADIAQVHEGDICPKCGKPLKFCKGIEVGNTFKLGTKYAKALGLEYQDVNNKLHPVEMGCYGFGLERCMAAIVEQHNDASGIIWPTSVAPFEVAVVVVSSKDDEQMRIGNELYEALKKEGIDVLLDDRKERPGVKFKDMELIGIPYRITVGRGIKDGNVEFRARTADESSDVSLHEIVDMVKKELQK